MPLTCTRCSGSGFINLHQIDDDVLASFNESDDFHQTVLDWITEHEDENYDVSVCDCCGGTDAWYGIPGEHYNCDDPKGKDGSYLYGGGFCECH